MPSATAPSGALSRRAGMAGIAAAFAVVMVGTTLPTPLYVLYRERFGFSELMVTVIFATYAVGVLAALVLFGGLSDQVGRRRVLLPGVLLSAASAVAFLLAQGLAPLLVGRLLSGLSAGIFTGTATATVVDLAGPEAGSRGTLLATVANMGGLGCGPLLAGLMATVAGDPLRLVFFVDLALLVAATAVVLLAPEPVQRRERGRLRLRVPRVPGETRAVFVSAALAGFAGFAVLGLFTAVAPAFLGEVLAVKSHLAVGAVVFAVFVASTAGQLLLEWTPSRVALLGGTAALAVGMAVLAGGLAAASLGLLIAGGMIAGLGQGLSFRAGMAAVTGAAPEDQRAEVASAFFVVAYVAISLPVVGVGLLAQAASLKTAGLVFAAVVIALSLVAAGLLRRFTAR